MNLFEMGDKDSQFPEGFTWDDALHMFTEGAEMSTTGMDVALDDLQEYLAELVREGLMTEEVVFKLAAKEQAVFIAIHHMATLESITKVFGSFKDMLDRAAVEAKRVAEESA